MHPTNVPGCTTRTNEPPHMVSQFVANYMRQPPGYRCEHLAYFHASDGVRCGQCGELHPDHRGVPLRTRPLSEATRVVA